jgi:hypothetical protein
MDSDTFAAATLAAALLNSPHLQSSGRVGGIAFAAEVYFDCLEAIRAEREKRTQSQSESLRT